LQAQTSKHLTLLSIDHRVSVGVLLASNQLLAALGFLLLLDQVTESAAAGKGNIGDARSLEVILVTDVASLHGFWNPVKTNAHGGQEEQTRSVDWLISFHGSILAGSVMDLSESYARAAVSETAGLNWGAASKEGVGELLSILWRLSVDSLTNVSESLVETIFPVVDIVIVDWARGLGSSNSWGMLSNWGVNWSSYRSWGTSSRILLRWVLLLVFIWSSHCDYCEERSCLKTRK